MLTEDDLAAKVAQAFGEQASRRTPATIDAAGIFRRGRRRRHRQLASGAVSVTAVAGLVIGLLIGGSGSPASPRSAQGPAPISPSPSSSAPPKHGQLPGNTLLDAAVVPMLSAAAADAGMPRYYVLSPDSGEGTVLQVRDSATGKVISTVTPPAACAMKTYTVAAAGNDRDFVAGCDTRESTVFYRLQITSRGTVSALTPLAIPSPSDSFLSDMALTADGSKLAVSFSGSGKQGELEVVTPATGAVRTWTGGPSDLSWADHGRELGFFSGGSARGLHVLDVNAPGSTLSSARLILPQIVDSDDVQNAMLSPDGTTIIASVTYELRLNVHVRLKPDSVVGGVVEIDARTGKPLRILLAQHAWHPAGEGGLFISSCLLGSVDATGNHVLVSCDKFGRLDRGRFTALAGTAADTYFAAAW
ncbi:MAG TPA: hypothetical protein VGJ19_02010 [Streptosporangiaceae bacterium]|jgi:hypothetical protein